MIHRDELHVFLRGGLGNQLFQYGTGLFLSSSHSKSLVIRPDLLPLCQDSVAGVSRWPNQISAFRHSGEVRSKGSQPDSSTNLFSKYMQAMRLLGDISPRIAGRLGMIAGETSAQIPIRTQGVRIINSYSPFKEIMWEIRDQLSREVRQIQQPSQRFLRLKEKLLIDQPVVVHFRQGDYLNLESIYGSLAPDYFKRGIEAIREAGNSDKVWLFSDSQIPADSPYSIAIRPTRTLGPELSALESLVLMGQGSGLVASNSSFSWWAAFLMDSSIPVIAPHISSATTNNFSNYDRSFGNWTLTNA